MKYVQSSQKKTPCSSVSIANFVQVNAGCNTNVTKFIKKIIGFLASINFVNIFFIRLSNDKGIAGLFFAFDLFNFAQKWHLLQANKINFSKFGNIGSI